MGGSGYEKDMRGGAVRPTLRPDVDATSQEPTTKPASSKSDRVRA